MKTGFGLQKKSRMVFANFNLLRFWLRKTFIGFDVANNFIKRTDKLSLQLILRRNGAKIGYNCDIESGLIFHNCQDYSNLIIGDNCHIGKNCFFDLRDKVVIKNNVVISMQCTFITHIDMTQSSLAIKFPANKKQIEICNNSYVGADTTILKGVILNEKCFIAAKSLVIKDVNENTTVGGIPAKLLNI